MKVIPVVVMLGLAITAFILLILVCHPRPPQIIEFIPPPLAQVLVGEPLPWRELVPNDAGVSQGQEEIRGLEYQFAIGDFDADTADELYVYSLFLRECRLMELDGSRQELAVLPPGFVETTTWDCDLDGRADLIVNSPDYSAVSVINTAGRVLTRTESAEFDYQSGVADVDGDGIAELIINQVEGYDFSAILVIEPGGETSFVTDRCPLFMCLGDINGDGAAEIVTHSNLDEAGIIAYGGDGSVTELPWDFAATGCADLNGDGTAEIFCCGHGFMDPATGEYTQLVYPFSGNSENDGLAVRMIALDIDADGQPELVSTGSADGGPSGLLIFEADGSCVYYEEMGEFIGDCFSVHDAEGRAHLLVQTMSRLLIYP